MIQVNFYSQSEATLLNTKPRLIFFLVFTASSIDKGNGNAFEYEASIEYYSYVLPRFKHAIQHKFYSQSEATVLNTKPRLIIYLVHVFTCKSKLRDWGRVFSNVGRVVSSVGRVVSSVGRVVLSVGRVVSSVGRVVQGKLSRGRVVWHS